MTASDLNYAMQYIDDKYLDTVDVPEEEIMRKIARKKTKWLLIIFLAACLLIGKEIVILAYCI